MHSSLLVADYLLAHGNGILTPVHALMMPYFAHGYTLAISGKPLIRDEVYAWQQGPVYPVLFEYLKEYGTRPVPCLPYSGTGIHDDAISERKAFLNKAIGDTAILDKTLKSYGKLGGQEVMAISCRGGSPWATCYSRNRIKTIPDHITREYYAKCVNLKE